MTEELFKKIITKLKNGEKITDETAELLNIISLDESAVQRILLDFLNKIIETKKFNEKVIEIIQKFFSDNIDLKTASYELFNAGKIGYEESDDVYDNSLIRHDNIKRGLTNFVYPYKKAQFSHFRSDESHFDKMLRVLFEFTRDDEQYLRGVCFDYCLFLSALDIMKNKKTNYIIICGIEFNSEINYFMSNQSEVLDPFNGIYTSVNDYDKIKGIDSFIKPTGINLTKNDDSKITITGKAM